MEILKVSYQPWVQAGLEQEVQQQQNKREQEVQLDGRAGFEQHNSNMSAGMGLVGGFATAPLGEVVRHCLGPAIFGPGSTCWARSFCYCKGYARIPYSIG